MTSTHYWLIIGFSWLPAGGLHAIYWHSQKESWPFTIACLLSGWIGVAITTWLLACGFIDWFWNGLTVPAYYAITGKGSWSDIQRPYI